MMMKPKYPLEQLITIKKKRVEEAEKILKQAKEKLEAEKKVEEQRKQQREKAFQHKEDKLAQLREELDSEVNRIKIDQMKTYLKIAEEELRERERAVEKQEEIVQQAQVMVQQAKEDLLQKHRDLEKLTLHRKEWERETRALLAHKDALEGDELGTSMHSLKKHRK